MLIKNICKLCYQKNEMIWDERLWLGGYVECPRAEINRSFELSGKLIDRGSKLHSLFVGIYSAADVLEIPDHCQHHLK
jgi:hypothetical protein